MVHTIQNTSHSWIPPKRRQLSNTILLDIYQETIKKQRQIRSDASHQDLRFTIISDSATISKVPLTNFLVYVPPTNYQILKYDDATDHLAEGGRRTSEYYFSQFDDVIEECGPTNVMQVITDCAPVMVCAWKLIEEKYPWIFCSGCLAHQINTFVRHLLKDREGSNESEGSSIVKNMVKDCKQIVSQFNDIQANRALILKYSNQSLGKEYSFIVPSDTRFGLYLLMMHHLLILRPAITSAACDDSYQDNNCGVQGIVLQVDFWNSLTSLIEYLFPLLKIIRLVDSEQEAIGKVYPSIINITCHFNNHKDDQPFFNDIYQHWNEYHRDIISDLHRFAYCVDPEFIDVDHLANQELMNVMLKSLDKIFNYSQNKDNNMTIFMKQYHSYKSKEDSIFSSQLAQTQCKLKNKWK